MEFIYIGICAAILVAFIIVFLVRGNRFQKLSNLSIFAFTLIILGIVFSDAGRIVSYSFIGTGVVCSIIDLINKSKHKENRLPD
jgi:fucose 4-O-acetylase-like acetyltransferase